MCPIYREVWQRVARPRHACLPPFQHEGNVRGRHEAAYTEACPGASFTCPGKRCCLLQAGALLLPSCLPVVCSRQNKEGMRQAGRGGEGGGEMK